MPQKTPGPIADLSASYMRLMEALSTSTAISTSLDASVGTTAATGMAKASKSIWQTMWDYLKKIPGQLFGGTGGSGKSASDPSQLGIAKVLEILASIDLCSVINTLSNLKGKAIFDPNNPPKESGLPYTKWKVQKAAYDIQKSLDAFSAVYEATSDPAATINNLLLELVPLLEVIVGPAYLGDPQIKQSFPQTSPFNNFISDLIQKLLKTERINNSNKPAIKSILTSVGLLRQICVLIQGLTSPANLASYTSSIIDPKVVKSIDRLGVNNMNVKQIIVTLTQVQKKLTAIERTLAVITNTLSRVQAFIKICLSIVKIFKIIINFLKALPMPTMYTTVGINVTMSEAERELSDESDRMIAILSELNIMMAIIISMLQAVTGVIDLLLTSMDSIVTNLESCTRGGTNEPHMQMLKDIKQTVQNIRSSNDDVKSYIDNCRNKKNNSDLSYYNYTIKILTEVINDKEVQSITIPRRYGIAVNSAGIEVVSTDPTYASDDSIIISEVKLLLNSKHLIKSNPNALSLEEQAIVEESSNFLVDDTTPMDDIPIDSPTDQIDAPDNEDDNKGLGINAFFNKQKGGRKMREKVRKIMNQSKQKLNSDLQNVKK